MRNSKSEGGKKQYTTEVNVNKNSTTGTDKSESNLKPSH